VQHFVSLKQLPVDECSPLTTTVRQRTRTFPKIEDRLVSHPIHCYNSPIAPNNKLCPTSQLGLQLSFIPVSPRSLLTTILLEQPLQASTTRYSQTCLGKLSSRILSGSPSQVLFRAVSLVCYLCISVGSSLTRN
jgi:hypothetical protein